MRNKLPLILATATIAAALASTGCKQEPAKEAAQTPAPQTAPAAAQALVEYGYETDNGKWSPNGATVKVEQSTAAKKSGNASLKVSGTSGEGKWNFAFSPKFPLQAGKKYKLTAYMMVEGTKPASFPPLLKCGIYQDNKFLSNAFTKTYDLKKGGWQELSVTFDAPSDATQGFIAVEKGTDKPVEGTIYIDDVKFEAL
ncbi:carbohydrate binding domain-containing protein [Geomonas anaerohicana]|uniref:Carbohydrate binding domain-containing protein n=1 Tax=Geomonas anaerohicana TaxID=2798583 RepID=A0ABS0YH13_9BACT|nr:carbohydrate binding domain-containing protein [Geomonas anaerohicana]MBJ6751576.1 carbohydrate binding domain-containing protein [Geomonas anaerohicana]